MPLWGNIQKTWNAYLLATTHSINTTMNSSAIDPTLMPITAPMVSTSSDSWTSGVTVGDNITDVVVATEMVGLGVVNALDGVTMGTTRNK